MFVISLLIQVPFEPWIALTIGLERYIECSRDVDVYQSDKNSDENTTKIDLDNDALFQF